MKRKVAPISDFQVITCDESGPAVRDAVRKPVPGKMGLAVFIRAWWTDQGGIPRREYIFTTTENSWDDINREAITELGGKGLVRLTEAQSEEMLAAIKRQLKGSQVLAALVLEPRSAERKRAELRTAFADEVVKAP